MKHIFIFITGFFFILISANAKAQGSTGFKIQGAVIDSLLLKPLDKITMTLTGSNKPDQNIVTKADGHFEFTDLTNSSYNIRIHAVGYKPVE